MAEPASSATATDRSSKKRSRQETSDAELLGRSSKKKKNTSPIPTSPPILQPHSSSSKQDKRDKKKEKKKKKHTDSVIPNQGHEHVDPVENPENSQPVENDAATSAAFLSALVTAAAPGLHDQSAYAPMIDPFAQYNTGQFSLSSQYIPMPMLHPPPLPGAPFSELSFGSNDDILRTFQDLDVTKLASALRNLGDGTSLAGLDLSGLEGTSQAPNASQRPPSSIAKTVQTELRQGTKKHKRTLDMALPPPESSTLTSHDELLATKWLSVQKLNELAETDGLIYKKGKFSAIEAQQIKDALENYARNNSMTVEQVRDELIHSSERRKDQKFFSEMASAVPLRPVIAVYHYIRRAYHPNQKMGDWTPEQDAALKDAVIRLGPKWEKVAPEVGRAASDCRDRYRNHIHNRDRRKSGPWSKEEEDEVVTIITSLTNKHAKDLKAEGEIFWTTVSEKMQGRRSAQQCRIKWLDSLMNRLRNDGENSRWSSQDAFILVHKVDSMGVRDDSEIDWKRLPDPDWNAWSAHVLQRRWLTLKRAVKGYEDMTHQEIMDILRTKFAQLPSSPLSKRKVVSAEIIDDDEAVNETTSEVSRTGAASKSRRKVQVSSSSDDSDSSSSSSDSDDD